MVGGRGEAVTPVICTLCRNVATNYESEWLFGVPAEAASEHEDCQRFRGSDNKLFPRFAIKDLLNGPRHWLGQNFNDFIPNFVKSPYSGRFLLGENWLVEPIEIGRTDRVLPLTNDLNRNYARRFRFN